MKKNKISIAFYSQDEHDRWLESRVELKSIDKAIKFAKKKTLKLGKKYWGHLIRNIESDCIKKDQWFYSQLEFQVYDKQNDTYGDWTTFKDGTNDYIDQRCGNPLFSYTIRELKKMSIREGR